jgi:hypothetical protein
MKQLLYAFLSVSLGVLAGCAGSTADQSAIPSSTSAALPASRDAQAKSLSELVNLDYSNGSITVYSIQHGEAKVTETFSPGNGLAQGLAMDKLGLIYTTVTNSSSKQCSACVDVYTNTGKLKVQLPAPTLSPAPGPPSLTDVSVDRDENVYVSDYGQQAVYFFPHGNRGGHQVKIVVQDSSNAASVLATPNGANVIVSGGCGFASVRPFTATGSGEYQEGSCFGIGTIALIGGAVDNQEDVLTPVDGVAGLVSVSSPSGGASFRTPGRLASISGIALNDDASIAYVANATKGYVYAFARPAAGWLSKAKPKLVATYKGFSNLDIIAVRP